MTGEPSGRRRALIAVLGALWLLDGALLLQPDLLRSGSDGFLASLVQNAIGNENLYNRLEQHVLLDLHAHQVAGEVAVAVVQLAIGAALVTGALRRDGRLVRLALAVSLPWALAAWVVGQAFGRMIYPQASMVVGAPGSAVVYVVLALCLWPRRSAAAPGDSVAQGGSLGRSGPQVAWAIIWDATALLFLELGNRAPGGLAAVLSAQVVGNPGPLVSAVDGVSGILGDHGTLAAFFLAVAQVAIGQAALRPASRKAGLAAGIVLSAMYWVVGQDLGGLLSGTATDPNTAPVLVLVAIALWPGRVPTGDPQAGARLDGVRASEPHGTGHPTDRGAPEGATRCAPA